MRRHLRERGRVRGLELEGKVVHIVFFSSKFLQGSRDLTDHCSKDKVGCLVGLTGFPDTSFQLHSLVFPPIEHLSLNLCELQRQLEEGKVGLRNWEI